MKKNILFSFFIILSVFVPFFAWAGNTSSLSRVEVLVGSDNNGKISQDIKIPINWNDRFSSSIEYTGRSFSDKKKLDFDIRGKKGDLIEEDKFDAGIISYGKGLIKTGFGLEYIRINKKEIGYAWSGFDDDNIELVVVENDVKTHLLRPYISTDLTWGAIDNAFVFHTRLRLVPVSNLEVVHKTAIITYDSEVFKGDSDRLQNPSASLKCEMRLAITSNLIFGASASYDYLPVHYKMSYSANDSGKVDVKTEDSTFSYDARLILKAAVFKDLMPTAGFGIEKIKSKDKNNSDNNTTKKTKRVIIGFEKNF